FNKRFSACPAFAFEGKAEFGIIVPSSFSITSGSICIWNPDSKARALIRSRTWTGEELPFPAAATLHSGLAGLIAVISATATTQAQQAPRSTRVFVTVTDALAS